MINIVFNKVLIKITELICIRGKSLVPTSYNYDIKLQLLKIHPECLKKAMCLRIEKQVENKTLFSYRFKRIFYIYHHSTEKLIEISEDLLFLTSQRANWQH